jgi:hypothetical protein
MRVTKNQLQEKVYDLNCQINSLSALCDAQAKSMEQDSLEKLAMLTKIDDLFRRLHEYESECQWLNNIICNRESLINQAMNAINNIVINFRANKNVLTLESYLLATKTIDSFNDAKTFVYGESVWKDTTPEGRK